MNANKREANKREIIDVDLSLDLDDDDDEVKIIANPNKKVKATPKSPVSSSDEKVPFLLLWESPKNTRNKK